MRTTVTVYRKDYEALVKACDLCDAISEAAVPENERQLANDADLALERLMSAIRQYVPQRKAVAEKA